MQRLRAWFAGAAFARHRHDTYAVGITDIGVQSFWYRGSAHSSVRGDVIVLHPDEVHDGYAGTEDGFGYRILYIDPARVSDACRAIAGRAIGLPFVRQPVLRSKRLRVLLDAAFAAELEPLGADAIVVGLAEALLTEARQPAAMPQCADHAAVERAKRLLDSATQRLVHSSELEAASGLSRFELARQFKSLVGTTPYRYSLMRRLEWARGRIGVRPMAELALEAAFADQAHFSRVFKAAFGMPPGRFAALQRYAPHNLR